MARSKAADEDDGALGDELSALRREVSRLTARLGAEEEAIRARARAFAGDAASHIRRIEEDVAEATRARPWRGLGIAALIGLLLGLSIRR